MFTPKVKLSRELFERAEAHAEAAGYSSVQELVSHLLEKETAQKLEPDPEDLIQQRLKGLGYLA